MWSKLVSLGVVVAGVLIGASAQGPHDYPGKPSGDFSPAWQQYFQVTTPLPNVTFPLPRNWAGNIPVNRANHANNTLFFWGFEKENGSLTADAGQRSDEPWGIWLNGGPGSSSLLGLMFENGPIHIGPDYSVFANNYSWHHLADYFWIDQPVGTGFSTADAFVNDEDQMAEDFLGFLTNLVKVFPSLSSRPLYLTGESYAGTYIPYIMKAYFGMTNPPVKIAKIAIGDGSLGNTIENEQMPVLTVIETYPQLIGYDPEIYNYFKDQSHLCGYDINLTYPQNGHFPTLDPPGPWGPNMLAPERSRKLSILKRLLKADAEMTKRELGQRHTRYARQIEAQKRASPFVQVPPGTLDPMYRCDLLDEVLDYAAMYSFPWLNHDPFTGFDVYNVPDALEPEAPMDASVFLNDPRTVAALHAPTSGRWMDSVFYDFQGSRNGDDPSVEPMAFLSELATNASDHGVNIVIYSGNDDSLVSHRSSEVTIQNTTFGGIQGFTRKPSTPWYDDTGAFAGIVHQERNWTYILVANAGHLVPQQQPGRAYVLLREFVLGSNQTGLVLPASSSSQENGNMTVTVVGGEVEALKADVLPGQAGIYVGQGTTQSTYFFPSATVAAWESFIGTAVPTPPPSSGAGESSSGGGGKDAQPSQSQSQSQGSANEATRTTFPWMLVWLCVVMTVFYSLVH